MATNRLAILTQMLEQDPANTFARYGLAMEYVKAGELRPAIDEFVRLMEQDQDYVAAYYHAGQALEKVGELERARETYEKGIDVATRKGDLHTRGEIEAALSLLPI